MNAVSKMILENKIGRPICVTASVMARGNERNLPLRSCRMRSRFSMITTDGVHDDAEVNRARGKSGSPGMPRKSSSI